MLGLNRNITSGQTTALPAMSGHSGSRTILNPHGPQAIINSRDFSLDTKTQSREGTITQQPMTNRLLGNRQAFLN